MPVHVDRMPDGTIWRVTSSCGFRPSNEKRKHVMSAEDRALAKEKRERNKALKDARQLWEATLPDAWVPGSTRFRHQNGTAVSFWGVATRLCASHTSPSPARRRRTSTSRLCVPFTTASSRLGPRGAGSRQSKKNFFDPSPDMGTTLKMHDALYGPEARMARAEAQKKKAVQGATSASSIASSSSSAMLA